jgi:hypothetical protein
LWLSLQVKDVVLRKSSPGGSAVAPGSCSCNEVCCCLLSAGEGCAVAYQQPQPEASGDAVALHAGYCKLSLTIVMYCCLQVKAVVLRINSPGGSAVASDMIAREVQLLKEAGKPVVACMGDVAASGGYFIAGTTCSWSCHASL